MRITLRRFIVLTFIISVAGLVSAYPQMCGQWTVSIELADQQNKPLENASVSFVDVPEGDVAKERSFKRSDSARNVYVTTFIEGDRVSKEYKLLIMANGFVDLSTTTKIDYCRKTSEKKFLDRRPADPNIGSGLTGTVYDANGSVVVKAKVTAVNTKGKKFETITNEEGIYVLTLPFNVYPLFESTYNIIVDSPGFRRSETKGYVFIPSQFGKMHLDIALVVGRFVD